MPTYWHPRFLLSGAPVGKFEVGVIAAGYPRFSACTKDVIELAPRITAGFICLGYGVETPSEFAGVCVVCADVAVVFNIARAACKSEDNATVGNDRSARVFETLGVVGNRRFPNLFARARVECDESRIGCCLNNFVVVDSDITHVLTIRRASPVFPNQLACFAVQSLNDIARIDEINDSLVDQRRRLGIAFVHIPHPFEAEAVDIGGVYLIERAKAVRVVAATYHRPVGGIWRFEHRIGHWHKR